MKQCFETHLVNEARNRTAQAMKRTRQVVLHEYCCEADSVLCRIAN